MQKINKSWGGWKTGLLVGIAAVGLACAVRADTYTYMVIDVSEGSTATNYPVSYTNAIPSGGWTDEYKTTKIVLRKIPAGTFTMGSPSGELGRDSDETQHSVTLSKDFYVGVFQVTQKQWELVMGNWPSYFNNTTYRDSRPVEQVSYFDIRENPANSAISPNWPDSAQVHADSFMGKLRAKTGLTTLDLPTESQWEYACRAGTTTALNSGKNLTATGECSNMSEVGRYYYNHPGGYSSSSSVGTDGGTAKVGSYSANAYGLFDMHGNVWEWCLDWYGTYPGTVTDPKGASSGSNRVRRGGSWDYGAHLCRSAYRSGFNPSGRSSSSGFRLARTLLPHTLTVVSGTGGGAYAVGTAVAVTADAAPAGQVFDCWTVDPSEVDLGAFFDSADAYTIVIMPAQDVMLTADYTEAETIATPTFNPDGGAHPGDSVNVTITCVTEGATIRYTTNGIAPTTNSATVTSGGSVSIPVPGTLKAKAWKTGMNPSAVKSASYTEADDPATGSVPVYRFYSSGAQESTYTHLWTINTAERDALMAFPSWEYEGIGWYALTSTESGTVPLYRLYEPNIRRHLYTINATEYVALDGGSWNGEDVQYFVYPTNSVSGAIPAYRFYHSVNQNHHFTISENEKDTIVANSDWGYTYEGIAFYVFQTNAPSSFRSPVAQAEQKAKQTAVVSEYAHAGHGIQDSMSYEEQTAVKHNIRYNPQTGRWYLISETEQSELIPVPGDYSGNGIEDLALYEQATGNWHIRFTEAQSDDAFITIQWGGPGFTPVSGDFNKDGISDLAVYHEDTGTWYITTVDGRILVWGLELDESVSVE